MLKAILDEMSVMEIEKADRNTLADIKNVDLDVSEPIAKRMLQYLEQVKNPYCFLCGKTPVKISFSPSGRTLDEALKSHFLGLKTQ